MRTRPNMMPLFRGILEDIKPKMADGSRPCILAFWCPYCDTHHRHGWDARDNGNHWEHRVAHCPPESPLHKDGYYISPFRKNDPERRGINFILLDYQSSDF